MCLRHKRKSALECQHIALAKRFWSISTHTAKTHLGLYPLPEGIEAFKDKLTAYKTAKGVVQFPYKIYRMI
ncbi:MAG: hypothetical protein FWE13_00900 [Firmicutes bacterium]|nr:hypothetical protein [Bacillota bacterium]